MIMNAVMLKLKSQKDQPFQVNRHFVFVEAPIRIVGPEAEVWGEGEWWPKDSGVKVTRQTNGALAVGTRYLHSVNKPFVKDWISEVTKYVPGKLVERTFRGGLLEGFEAVTIEERSNGTRVDYELHYRVNGLVGKLLWLLIYRRKHDENIKKILEALKNYSLMQYQKQQGKHLEA